MQSIKSEFRSCNIQQYKIHPVVALVVHLLGRHLLPFHNRLGNTNLANRWFVLFVFVSPLISQYWKQLVVHIKISSNQISCKKKISNKQRHESIMNQSESYFVKRNQLRFYIFHSSIFTYRIGHSDKPKLVSAPQQFGILANRLHNVLLAMSHFDRCTHSIRM